MRALEHIVITDANMTTNVTEDANPIWVSGTAYSVGNLVHRVETHRIYKCAVATSSTVAPEDNVSEWQDVGPTNAWAMFDRENGSQTQNVDSITFSITPDGLVDALAVINVNAIEMTVEMSTVADGIVYSKTEPLVIRSVSDWREFWVKLPVRKQRVVLDDLPLYLDATITITLTAIGETVECGTFVTGMLKSIGDTVWGSNGGINDFSVKDTDEFGNWTIRPRPFRDRDSFDVEVPTAKLDGVRQYLSQKRAVPQLWIGSSLYQGMITYAMCKNFEVNYSNAVISHVTLELEGLTS